MTAFNREVCAAEDYKIVNPCSPNLLCETTLGALSCREPKETIDLDEARREYYVTNVCGSLDQYYEYYGGTAKT